MRNGYQKELEAVRVTWTVQKDCFGSKIGVSARGLKVNSLKGIKVLSF